MTDDPHEKKKLSGPVAVGIAVAMSILFLIVILMFWILA